MRNLLDPLDARPVSYAIADDPARVSDDDFFEDCSPTFEELPERKQLDAIERICRHDPFYRRVLKDFFLDNPEVEHQLLGLAVDSCIGNDDLGVTLREKLVEYFSRVIAARGDDILEMIP